MIGVMAGAFIGTLAAVFMIECAADWNSPISWRRIEGVLLLFAAIGGLIGRAVIP
jgi:hypothetical protein